MNNLLLWIGRAAGVAGVLLCIVAAAVRLSGAFWVAGMQVTPLRIGGMALMLAACLS